MLKTLTALNNFLGTLLALAAVTLLGSGGWFAYRTYYAEKWAAQEARERLAHREAQIEQLEGDLKVHQQKVGQLSDELSASRARANRLQEEVTRQAAQIQRLETAMRLLKVDHRIAHIDVLNQQGSAGAGDLVTQFRFVEVDEQGKALEEPRAFTVAGDVVYLDAWVVKFADEHIEAGDPLRATSVCLFRRIFGESQQPKDGFVLDPVGLRPAAYGPRGKMSDLEREIWTRFWEYANDPAKAKKAGVRAAHGEAPSIKLMRGKRYEVKLRSSGGLSIAPGDLPADPHRPAL